MQVKSLVFHPVQPWLAYADVNQAITVWDWSSQQVRFQIRAHACYASHRTPNHSPGTLFTSSITFPGFLWHILKEWQGLLKPWQPCRRHGTSPLVYTQVVWEAQLSAADEGALQDAMLQRLAEKESGYYGKAGIPRPGATAKGTAPGAVSSSHILCKQ